MATGRGRVTARVFTSKRTVFSFSVTVWPCMGQCISRQGNGRVGRDSNIGERDSRTADWDSGIEEQESSIADWDSSMGESESRQVAYEIAA